MQPTTPNPDTHCTSCGEVLSLYSHCWKCECPPMDPAQDVTCAPLTATNTSASVLRAGITLGTVSCINTAPSSQPAAIRWYGQKADRTASGQAHPTQAQAVADVVAWAEGQQVAYPKQAITQTTTVAGKPHHIPCGECGACYANESCGLLQSQATPAK